MQVNVLRLCSSLNWGVVVKASDVALAIVEMLPQALCVSSLGTATSALRLASNDGPHFYFGAAMGSALASALGVAEALPDYQIVALLGDGELLMGAGTLWSLSAYRPPNLLSVVLSDGAYSITGGQPLSSLPRFVEVAQSLVGIESVRVGKIEDLRRALLELKRPGLIEATLDEREWPGPSPFIDPAKIRLDFAANIARGPKSVPVS
jgi:thiamine pyrophosphate-dependent acetolactate synthase large subunit-like protein